jgi:hypothetical protein
VQSRKVFDQNTSPKNFFLVLHFFLLFNHPEQAEVSSHASAAVEGGGVEVRR